MLIHNNQKRPSESGNVLFLILIAVALFAALSYAVTQSTRSGGGSTEREQALLGSSAMTQYPTALRTSVIRMILGGVGAESVLFNPPSNSFSGETATDQLVFHPSGGGAVYQESAADVMSGTSQGVWNFNAQWEVPAIGIDGAGGADIVAFLPGVSTAVCERVNDELNINTTGCTLTGALPQLAAAQTGGNIDVQSQQLSTADGSGGAQASGGIPGTAPNQLVMVGASCDAFSGQASGCFIDDDTGNRNVFFSVLLER